MIDWVYFKDHKDLGGGGGGGSDFGCTLDLEVNKQMFDSLQLFGVSVGMWYICGLSSINLNTPSK